MTTQTQIPFPGIKQKIPPPFKGSNYDPVLDAARLSKQIWIILQVMSDGQWRTFTEINKAANKAYSEASISAQLRNLRKVEFGAHKINKRRRGQPDNGLFEYQLILNKI